MSIPGAPDAGLNQTTGSTVVASPTVTTKYTVTSRVDIDPTSGVSYCVLGTQSVTVTVNPLPVVTIVLSQPTICAGNSATITANVAGTSNYSYVWTVPSGATNPGNVSSFLATVAGTYTVTVTDLVTTCVSLTATASLAVQVCIICPPPVTVCPSVNVEFTTISQFIAAGAEVTFICPYTDTNIDLISSTSDDQTCPETITQVYEYMG